MNLFGKTFGKWDLVAIAGTIATMTPDDLQQLQTGTTWHRILFGIVIIARIVNNAAPAGSQKAIIPQGSVPVVADAPGIGALTVAHVDDLDAIAATSRSASRPSAPPTQA